MDYVWICVGWAMIAVGVVGCFVPVVPGPPIAFAALCLVRAVGDHSSPAVSLMVIAGVLTVLVTVLDSVVPMLGAKKFNCSMMGTVGCFAGTVVGLFFLPLGVLLGPFLGALAGELIAGKEFADSLKGAVGALLGYVFGIMLKLVCCALLGYWFYTSLP